jgi:hypothetical protein
MTRNTSNQNGRALEFIIVKKLLLYLEGTLNASLSARASKDQSRDSAHFIGLTPDMQRSYESCAIKITFWLESKFQISRSQNLLIDRLPDDAAKRGDVTDIRLAFDLKEVNLSIKHNHLALKHQRPEGTAQHCGYIKKSGEDVLFRQQYKIIATKFLSIANGYSNFRDLPEGVVHKYLYTPICDLVAKFINTYCRLPDNANHLFKFLVGQTNFYKIIFDERRKIIKISEFSEIEDVISVRAESKGSYVYLYFSNNWHIAMRLHTASSRIARNPGLKFDTQPAQIEVPVEEITYS